MGYEVKLTAQAIGQMEETVQYISKILLEPETARKWADTLECEIGKLSFMPSRYPLTEEEPWHAKGIRKMSVKNFLVYFLLTRKRKWCGSRQSSMGGEIRLRLCQIFRETKQTDQSAAFKHKSLDAFFHDQISTSAHLFCSQFLQYLL